MTPLSADQEAKLRATLVKYGLLAPSGRPAVAKAR
jgi:hypothetical protein